MAALLKMPTALKVPDFLRNPFRPTYLMVAAVLLIAVILGLFTPIFVGMIDGQVSKMVALPAAMLFGLMLVYDRKLSLLMIILLRASSDNVLELTRFSIGGYPLGIGALINGCVIMIALLLVFEKPKQAPSSAYSAWAPFLVVTLLGVLISPVKGDAIRLYLSLLSYFAMFIAGFYCARDKLEFRQCIKLIVWSSAIPVLYSFVDFALHRGLGEFRLRSTFGHPNVLAFYATVIIALAFYLLKTLPAKSPTRYQVFLSLYIVVLLGVLALTKTRSAWAATGISFGLYALLFERRYLIYIFLLGAGALMIPGVLDRFTDLSQGNTVGTYANLNSFAWRVYLWQTAMEWIRPSTYFFGNGFQSFKEYSPIFFPFAGKTNFGAHSVYIQLFFELGIAGVLGFCWLFFSVLKQLKNLVKIDPLAAFSLIVVVVNFLICCFSDNMLDYLVYAWYLWFAVGAGCALVRNGKAPA
jgi:hypothetical protein